MTISVILSTSQDLGGYPSFSTNPDELLLGSDLGA
jgi:hypothetical protein